MSYASEGEGCGAVVLLFGLLAVVGMAMGYLDSGESLDSPPETFRGEWVQIKQDGDWTDSEMRDWGSNILQNERSPNRVKVTQDAVTLVKWVADGPLSQFNRVVVRGALTSVNYKGDLLWNLKKSRPEAREWGSKMFVIFETGSGREHYLELMVAENREQLLISEVIPTGVTDQNGDMDAAYDFLGLFERRK